MTDRNRQRPKQQSRALTAVLVLGSLAATAAGTRVLAGRDGAQAEVAAAPLPAATAAPAVRSAPALPPTGEGLRLELQPIPQVVQRRVAPVARTRSSR